jgi:hypothetical protein
MENVFWRARGRCWGKGYWDKGNVREGIEKMKEVVR